MAEGRLRLADKSPPARGGVPPMGGGVVGETVAAAPRIAGGWLRSPILKSVTNSGDE